LTKALHRAIQITYAEFKIPGDFPPVSGSDCLSIRASWEKAVKIAMEHATGRGRYIRRLGLAFKSCKRLFDVECPPCDKKAGDVARKKWDAHVATDVPISELRRCQSWLPSLEARVRILATGWGRRLRERRVQGGDPVLNEYVPDQQGCYEVLSCQGGTLACSDADLSGRPNLLRRGVAKTKGKHRVVTMQSAGVKRVLAPVHNALYDHISSFGWCVRGDITKGDFETVLNDRREGESFISGDYQSATDNIYLPAVETIVRVISEDPELTEEEREVLLESFTDVRWKRLAFDDEFVIKRGSMMGNLVSFPLLCLLNKASFDIACDITYDGEVDRKGRFNGDDCLFCGPPEFFATWARVTSAFGLVVNEEKTGVSRRWMEMNSSIYDAIQHRFIAKPVLSFLLPTRNVPGTILPAVIEGISSFRWSVQQWIVKVLMRYEICLRGILPGLSCLGRRWRSELLRCRWFRAACLADAPPVRERGEKRCLDVVPGPPPVSRSYSFVSEASAEISRDLVDQWKGIRVMPYTQRLCRTDLKQWKKKLHSPRLASRFSWGGWKWSFCWPRELLVFFEDHFPDLLNHRNHQKWADDHPFLSRVPRVFETRYFIPTRSNPLFSSHFCTDYPLGYY
jgi:hypothetical protein